MKKLFILSLFLLFTSGTLMAQHKHAGNHTHADKPAHAGNHAHVAKKESKAAQKEEKKIDKEIKAEHKATSKYLENKKELKKVNRELIRDTKKFERQKRREILSPKEIRGWESDLNNQRRKIEKLEAEIEKYHMKYGKHVSKN